MEIPYLRIHDSQFHYLEYPCFAAMSSAEHDKWYQSQPFLGWSPEIEHYQTSINYLPYTSDPHFPTYSYQIQRENPYTCIPVFSGFDTPPIYTPLTEQPPLLNVEPYNPHVTIAPTQFDVVSINSDAATPIPQVFDECSERDFMFNSESVNHTCDVFDESFERVTQASQPIKEEFQFQMSEELREEILKKLAEMEEILSEYRKGESAEMAVGRVLNQKDKEEESDHSIQSEVKMFDESPKSVLVNKDGSFEVLSSEENDATTETTEKAGVVIKEEIDEVKVFDEETDQVLGTVKNFSELTYHEEAAANNLHQLFDENPQRDHEGTKLDAVTEVEPKPPDSMIQYEDDLFYKSYKQVLVEKEVDPLEGAKTRKESEVFDKIPVKGKEADSEEEGTDEENTDKCEKEKENLDVEAALVININAINMVLTWCISPTIILSPTNILNPGDISVARDGDFRFINEGGNDVYSPARVEIIYMFDPGGHTFDVSCLITQTSLNLFSNIYMIEFFPDKLTLGSVLRRHARLKDLSMGRQLYRFVQVYSFSKSEKHASLKGSISLFHDISALKVEENSVIVIDKYSFVKILEAPNLIRIVGIGITKIEKLVLLENVGFIKVCFMNGRMESWFAKLIALADLYVHDALGTAFSTCTLTEGLTNFLKPFVVVIFIQNELNCLVGVLSNCKTSFSVTVGGFKVSSKIGEVRSLLAKFDIHIQGGQDEDANNETVKIANEKADHGRVFLVAILNDEVNKKLESTYINVHLDMLEGIFVVNGAKQIWDREKQLKESKVPDDSRQDRNIIPYFELYAEGTMSDDTCGNQLRWWEFKPKHMHTCIRGAECFLKKNNTSNFLDSTVMDAQTEHVVETFGVAGMLAARKARFYKLISDEWCLLDCPIDVDFKKVINFDPGRITRSISIYSEVVFLQCKIEFLNARCDLVSSVQEPALSLVQNFVIGPIDTIKVFIVDFLLFQAVGTQLRSASRIDDLIQGIYIIYIVDQQWPRTSMLKQLVVKLLLSGNGKTKMRFTVTKHASFLAMLTLYLGWYTDLAKSSHQKLTILVASEGLFKCIGYLVMGRIIANDGGRNLMPGFLKYLSDNMPPFTVKHTKSCFFLWLVRCFTYTILLSRANCGMLMNKCGMLAEVLNFNCMVLILTGVVWVIAGVVRVIASS